MVSKNIMLQMSHQSLCIDWKFANWQPVKLEVIFLMK